MRASSTAHDRQPALADETNDGLLAVYTPQGATGPADAAAVLKKAQTGQAVLDEAHIPTFPYPDTAARNFTHMWRYTYDLRGLYETPTTRRGWRVMRHSVRRRS